MTTIVHPMKKGTYTVSSGYGPRWGTHHNGLDFAAPVGTPVYAPADGVVVQGKDRAQGSVQGFGSWIWLDCQASAGLDFIFGHVKHSGILVKRGDRVRAGQQIGVVGNEGESTGPHLHFEVWGPPGRSGGRHQDPARLLAGAREPGGVSAPAPRGTVIDTAARPPSPSVIKAAGHIGHVVYVSPDRTRGGLPGKPVSRAHVDAMRAAGMGIACVWQYGKDGGDAPPDFRRGHDGGVADARAADKKLTELGLSGWPVFFAVDVDIDPDTDHRSWEQIRAYMRGAASVIGRDRCGIYGGWKVVEGACRDALIANLGTAGKQLAWQTRSWSAGRIHSAAVLYQRIVDTKANPAPRIGGVAVDVNDVLHADWGQKPRTGTAPTPTPPKEKPLGTQFQADVTMLTTVDRGKRDPSRVPHITLHTYECPRESGAAALRNRAGWQQDSRTGSYTMLIAADGATLRANDDDYTPCASLPTGDVNGFHLSFLGYARDSRAEWLKYPEQLRSAARISADYIRRYGHEPRHLTVAEVRGRKAKGFATHDDVSKAFRESTHTDPGPNFPWDVFLDMVHQELREPGRGEPRPGGTPPAPNPKENNVLPETIRSIINPTVELPIATLFALLDAYAWEQRAAMKHLYGELGLDYQATIDAAIAADREEKQQ
ncbi:glycoside hydrolase domain-containing protein [Corynebacterium hansenii]|uniref:Glycoside hydrolase domain-containing protein n=1 Tax=Corynebacterium hansenii TaxID=394964 RepID=A0ABV7ZLE9_9CORY|nr:glycoside hydrolase domain-containing protein [Corynebacterium hansenii]WJY99269.1 Murein DD-endopeptidase MepM [Corynebacterium hansenii]